VRAGQAYALLAIVTVIWAGNFPLAKAGLAQLSPVTLTAPRALLTAEAPFGELAAVVPHLATRGAGEARGVGVAVVAQRGLA